MTACKLSLDLFWPFSFSVHWLAEKALFLSTLPVDFRHGKQNWDWLWHGGGHLYQPHVPHHCVRHALLCQEWLVWFALQKLYGKYHKEYVHFNVPYIWQFWICELIFLISAPELCPLHSWSLFDTRKQISAFQLKTGHKMLLRNKIKI